MPGYALRVRVRALVRVLARVKGSGICDTRGVQRRRVSEPSKCRHGTNLFTGEGGIGQTPGTYNLSTLLRVECAHSSALPYTWQTSSSHPCVVAGGWKAGDRRGHGMKVGRSRSMRVSKTPRGMRGRVAVKRVRTTFVYQAMGKGAGAWWK